MIKLLVIFSILFPTIGFATNKASPKILDAKSDNAIAKEYLSGIYAARNNNYAEASKLFAEALTKSPDNLTLLHEAYKYTLFAGDNAKAAIYAEKYLEKDKNSVAPSLLLAVYAASKNDFSKAKATLANIKATKENNAVIIDQLLMPFIKMWIIAGESKYDAALNVLDPKNSSKMISATFVSLQKALLYSISGHNEKAEPIFTSLAMEKGTLPYHLTKSIATFYESTGKWEEASKIYKKYRLQHPTSLYFENFEAQIKSKTTKGLYIANPKDGLAEVLKEATRLLFSSQLYKEGLFYLRLALMLRPEDDESLMLLATYYEALQNWEQAFDTYSKIPQSSDIYYNSQINIAEDLYHLGKKSDTKEILEKVTKEVRAKYIPLTILADLLRQDSEYKAAIKTYNKVLENIDPKSKESWSIFFARGICYERIKEWEKSEQDLLTALELNHGQPEVTNYLAYSWLENNKNIEKAKLMLLKAAAMRPNNSQILDSAGWALYKNGDYTTAALFLEKATEITPQDAVMNDHLGDIYWKQGRRYEARYQWERAIKYGPAESSSNEKLSHKIEKGID